MGNKCLKTNSHWILPHIVPTARGDFIDWKYGFVSMIIRSLP